MVSRQSNIHVHAGTRCAGKPSTSMSFESKIHYNICVDIETHRKITVTLHLHVNDTSKLCQMNQPCFIVLIVY